MAPQRAKHPPNIVDSSVRNTDGVLLCPSSMLFNAADLLAGKSRRDIGLNQINALSFQ
jgi:hypothetical protein